MSTVNIKNFSREEQWLLAEKYNGRIGATFARDCARLSRGEPLAYVIGHVPFLHHTIDLSERVHIPRPETEFWTALVIDHLTQDSREHLHCLDLFSGSGCTGIAVLAQVIKTTMDFADISARSVRQISKNLVKNGMASPRARVVRSDLFQNLENRRYDYIFANPPYLARDHAYRVQNSVVAYEPHRAIFGGSDGLMHIQKFLSHARKYLMPRGMIVMEFDDIQKEAIEKIALRAGFVPDFMKDHYGAWRFVFLA